MWLEGFGEGDKEGRPTKWDAPAIVGAREMVGSGGGLELVAHAGHGDYVLRAGWVRFNLLAQAADEDVEVFTLVSVFRPPDPAEQSGVGAACAELLGRGLG